MRQSRHRSALGAWLLSALLVLLSCSPVLAQGAQVRNVILLIGDGWDRAHHRRPDQLARRIPCLTWTPCP